MLKPSLDFTLTLYVKTFALNHAKILYKYIFCIP